MAVWSAQETTALRAHYAQLMGATVTVQRRTEARDAAQGITTTYAAVTNLTGIAARVHPLGTQPREQGTGNQVRVVADWAIDLMEFATAIQPSDRVVRTDVTPNITYEVTDDLGSSNDGIYRRLAAVRVR